MRHLLRDIQLQHVACNPTLGHNFVSFEQLSEQLQQKVENRDNPNETWCLMCGVHKSKFDEIMTHDFSC